MIYAVDFDGTLCENAYPNIGKEKTNIISIVRQLKKEGHKIILWTCRSNEKLKDAVTWCMEHGLFFDAVNDNLPEIVKKYNNNSRKINADYYIDDKAINIIEE